MASIPHQQSKKKEETCEHYRVHQAGSGEGRAAGDRWIHIADDNFAQLDPPGSAKTLAAAIRKEKADLVLTGLQSDDHGFGQTGVLLAGLLDLPHATIIMQIEVAEGRM